MLLWLCHGILRTLASQNYFSGILRDIQQYLAMFRYIEGYQGIFRHYLGVWSQNQTYAELCVILAYTTVQYPELWLIYNPRYLQKSVNHVRWPCIFRALALSEQFIQAFSRIFRHIQGYWCIFSHIYRHATRGERGGLPWPFWKSIDWKSMIFQKPWFLKERS